MMFLFGFISGVVATTLIVSVILYVVQKIEDDGYHNDF